jgi:outer membrane protein OmpA-like peptidoglycan-associated protein
MNDRRIQRKDATQGGGNGESGLSPGKRTLTQDMQPVQLRAAGGGEHGDGEPADGEPGGTGDGGDAAEIAAEGVAGGGGALPHLDEIQRSFGRHDVRGVSAHTGGAAARATGALGAEAYAFGDSVAFGGAPSLHTAAHEAAHVVQQRSGISVPGGMGQEGDAYERHADKVVAGESAEPLLDDLAGSGGGGGGESVQARTAGSLGQAMAARFVQRRGSRARALVQRTTSNGVTVSNVRFTPGEIKDDGATTAQASASYSARISTGAALTWSIEGTPFGAAIDAATGVITPGTDTVPIEKDKVKLAVKAVDSKQAGAHATGHLTLWNRKFLEAKADFPKFIATNYTKASFVSPATGLGKFDVKYAPGAKTLDITVKVKFDFKDDDPAVKKKWSAKQKQSYISTFMTKARTAWSGQWQFANVREPKLVWGKLGPVSVRTQAKKDDAAPHFAITVHKVTTRPVVFAAGTADFDASHEKTFNNPFPNTKKAEVDALTAKLPTPVVFAPGSAALPAGSQAQLEFVGTYLHQARSPKMTVTATGHVAPDPAAVTPKQKATAAAAALTLSRQRAAAVKAAIASKGVGAHTLAVVAKGDTAGVAAPAGDKVDLAATGDPGFVNKHDYLPHEFGHMLGLDDEYTDPAGHAKGDKTAHYGLTDELLGGDSADSFARASDDSEGIMNGGRDVRPHHYVTLWEALGQVSGTAAVPTTKFTRADWKISGM